MRTSNGLSFRLIARRLGGLVAGAAMALAVALPMQSATAQDSGNLARQVEQLRREMADLQRYVYKGGKPPASPSGTTGEQVSPEVGARMQVQITQMQDQMREMNGRVEEVQHRIKVLEDRLDRLNNDLELRLQQMEDALAKAQSTGGQVAEGQAGAAQGGANGGSDGNASASTPSAGSAQLPDGTPREQYDFAYNLLKQHQWVEGRAALEAFLKKNPDDELSDNAAYWLGETYYINKQYKEAAKAFLDGYRKYPKADKAPDNLLKLGKSLDALGQPDKACTTYAKLLEDYPNSLPRIVKLAQSERKRLNCK